MSALTGHRFKFQDRQEQSKIWAVLEFREGYEILQATMGRHYLRGAELELDMDAPSHLLELRYRDQQQQEHQETVELFPPLARFATTARRATLPWCRPLLPLHCRNLTRLELRLQPLDCQSVEDFYRGTDEQEDFLLKHWDYNLALDNPGARAELDLSTVLPGPHGFVAVELCADGCWRQSLLLDISNLGLSYFHMRRNRFILCTDLTQAQPCPQVIFPSGQTDAGGMLANLGRVFSSWMSLDGEGGAQVGRLGELEVAVPSDRASETSWSRGRFFLLKAHLPATKELVIAGWLVRQNCPASPLEPAFAGPLEANCWGQPQTQSLTPGGGFLLRWPWQPHELRLSLTAPGPEGDHYQLQLKPKKSQYSWEAPTEPGPSLPVCTLELPQDPVQPGQSLLVRLGLEHWPAHVLVGLWRGDLCQLQNRRIDAPWSEWSFPIESGMEPGVLVRADAFCAQGHFSAQQPLKVADDARRLQVDLDISDPGQLQIQIQPPAPTEVLVLLELDEGESPDPLTCFLTPPECWLTLTSNLDRLPGRQPPGAPEAPAQPPIQPINQALYLGLHQTDQHGQLQLQLPIPDPGQSYRLRVHAAAGSQRFGTAEAQFFFQDSAPAGGVEP